MISLVLKLIRLSYTFSVSALQEAGLSREEAVEQVTNGFGDDNRKKISLAVAGYSDEEVSVMEYMRTSAAESQSMCVERGHHREHQTQVQEQHDTERQHQTPTVQSISVDCRKDITENYATQDDSALEILASMSVGDRVPESVMAAASGDRRGQFHNIRMEWFVEFAWLELEEMTLKLFCRYCKYFDPCGVFSVGKIAAHTKYEDIKKHNSSESHRQSLLMHTEQFPDTIQHIQQDKNTHDSNYSNESLTKITPHHWSILFPWMQHDVATDTLFCQPCQQDGMSGSWVVGIARSEINIAEIEEHEKLVSHRTAVVQHKRRHLATLATPTMSLVSQQTGNTSESQLTDISPTKAKRKRGRPRKYPSG